MAEHDFCCPTCGGGPPYGPYPKGSNQVSGHTDNQCLSHFMAKDREHFAHRAEFKAKLERVYEVCTAFEFQSDMSTAAAVTMQKTWEAVCELVDWYDEEYERSGYDDSELPKALLELEAKVEATREAAEAVMDIG